MVGTGDTLSLAAEARGRGRCSDDAKRVFRGEDLSLLLLYTLFLSATAKFFVVHSKLKRTLANALLMRTLSLRRFVLLLESVVEFLLLLVVHRVPVCFKRLMFRFRVSFWFSFSLIE